ncbi:Epiglycanin [Rhodotorula toruloides ATCC 204091]|uniref:Epiglycanin n=1 Tax=Rhodotorula toruloides TaxID=5286 RepID=A0A0K3CCC8_RHOTO|nr:Epiglycanin [Rhodotorula toruloides ATCC 204091]KAK4336354.1 Epiglycanin [Rhodotorula toruloides]PRQ74319.1 Epiglycanin [Rhodotorula toruloides]
MTRLASLATALSLTCALFAAPAAAQSSSPSASSTPSSSSLAGSSTSSASPAAATASGAANATSVVTVEGLVPAFATGSSSTMNSTIQTGWSTDDARGTMKEGLTLLQNSTGTAENRTIYGVLLYFNETTANQNFSSTPIPWIAYISCDDAMQNYTMPENSSTPAATNGTASAGGNSTQTANVLQQAEQLGAKGVVLYSTREQSCMLNYTMLAGNMTATNATLANSTMTNSTMANSTMVAGGNSTSFVNGSIPIFSATSQRVAQIIISQFSNVDPNHRYFNSSALSAATANLTAVIPTNGSVNLNVPTNFVLAQIVPSYSANDSSNGVVATLSRAQPAPTDSTTSRSASGSAPSQSATGGPSSGVAKRDGGRSKVSLAVTGFLVGGLLGGMGLLL